MKTIYKEDILNEISKNKFKLSLTDFSKQINQSNIRHSIDNAVNDVSLVIKDFISSFIEKNTSLSLDKSDVLKHFDKAIKEISIFIQNSDDISIRASAGGIDSIVNENDSQEFKEYAKTYSRSHSGGSLTLNIPLKLMKHIQSNPDTFNKIMFNLIFHEVSHLIPILISSNYHFLFDEQVVVLMQNKFGKEVPMDTLLWEASKDLYDEDIMLNLISEQKEFYTGLTDIISKIENNDNDEISNSVMKKLNIPNGLDFDFSQILSIFDRVEEKFKSRPLKEKRLKVSNVLGKRKISDNISEMEYFEAFQLEYDSNYVSSIINDKMMEQLKYNSNRKTQDMRHKSFSQPVVLIKDIFEEIVLDDNITDEDKKKMISFLLEIHGMEEQLHFVDNYILSIRNRTIKNKSNKVKQIYHNN